MWHRRSSKEWGDKHFWSQPRRKARAGVGRGYQDDVGLVIFGDLTRAKPVRLGLIRHTQPLALCADQRLLSVDMRTGAIQDKSCAATACSPARRQGAGSPAPEDVEVVASRSDPHGNKVVVESGVSALPGSRKLHAGQEMNGRNELRNPSQGHILCQLRKPAAIRGGKDRHLFSALSEQIGWQRGVRGTSGRKCNSHSTLDVA